MQSLLFPGSGRWFSDCEDSNCYADPRLWSIDLQKMPGTMLYISVETFGALALTCLVIELTPGPNMAYLAVLSAGTGRRNSAPAPAVARASISVVQW